MSDTTSTIGSVLVVDDMPLNLEVVIEHLINADFDVYVATTGEEALGQVKRVQPDLILLDIMLPGIDGFAACEHLKKNTDTADIPVIFMTALADVSNIVKGFKVGAVDYVTKPIQREELIARVNTHVALQKTRKHLLDINENLERRVAERTAQLRAALRNVEQLKQRLQAENTYLHETIKESHNFDEIIGGSEALKRVLRDVEEVAPNDTTVLILGETGTGKEVIARAVHNASQRQAKPFIKVNCAAIPENLVESEFFGHEKGAFTGATAKRDGRFTLADGGTIFLDEIGELPLDLQSKLLRVIQEGEFDPVGSSRTKKVNVRVIAATHRNLRQAVNDGVFREDLYYRLNVFPIEVPPLRERGNDILLLASFFADQCAKKMGKDIAPISVAMARRLSDYNWPGNIRELQNVIERATITATNGWLNLDRALPPAKAGGASFIPADSQEASHKVLTMQELRDLEKQNIILALKSCDWQVAGNNGAAALLQIKPTTLSSRIKALGIIKS